MPDDENFSDAVRRQLQGYGDSAAPPADAMWARIESDVARAIGAPTARRRQSRWPWMAAGVGIAAALIVGVAIGRRSVAQPAAMSVAVASGDDTARRAAGVRATTIDHLVQAEVFLTSVRADLKAGRGYPERAQRSRELLARTRLLLGNSEGGAPTIDRLLEDLELVLAEIAALPDGGRSLDAKILDERLREGTILPRIRTAVPASPAGL